MSAILNQQEHDLSNAQKWASLLASPQTANTRAPSLVPFLASKTRFVTSFDIPYAATESGKFSVIVRPEVVGGLLHTKNVGAYLPSTFEQIKAAALGRADIKDGYVCNTLFELYDRDERQLATFGFVPYSNIDQVHGDDRPLLPVTCEIGNMIYVDIMPANKNGCGTYKIEAYSSLGVVEGSVTGLVGVSGATLSLKPDATTIGLAIFRIDPHTSELFQMSGTDCVDISVAMSSGQLIALYDNTFTAESTTVGSVKNLGLQRVTAMSMLVTDMSPVLVAGGEIVTARTPLNNLVSSPGTPLTTIIKRLPEENNWRSANIKDGGYVWWLPNSIVEYEPKNLGDGSINSNVLVATGTLAQAGSLLRVLVTWFVEFYSPEQLYVRDYSSIYNHAHYDVWEALTKMPACSANIGHLALIAGAVKIGKMVYETYKEHEQEIDTVANMAYSALTAKAKKADNQARAERRKKKKKKVDAKRPPPLPPRP